MHGADGAERAWTVGWTGAEKARTVERTGRRGPRGADGAEEVRTGGRADWAVGGRRAPIGRTSSPVVGQTGGRANERVGVGLKGHIPRGPFHSWAPSPLASSERECVGCLGVQWGLVGFHIKHPYLAPGLTCLV